jgi:pimeloyl-ACP methyl ester carboxylesterase
MAGPLTNVRAGRGRTWSISRHGDTLHGVVAPFGDEPAFDVASADGTRIAVFAGGEGPQPPVVLVHGTASDHRTWRVVGPMLAADRRVFAMDRRGRGASGDAAGYTVQRELEDIAAVANRVEAEIGSPVAVVGHSLGGRLALAASPGTHAIRAVVAYESAPLPGDAPEGRDTDRLLDELRADLARRDLDALLGRFMAQAVGMPPDELAAFHANPIWPARAATGPTIVRELDAAAHDPAIGFEALARAAVPVLQLVGGESPAWFRDGAAALDERLGHGRLVVIDGARHAAHHSHPDAFLSAIRDFVDRS